MQRNDLGRWIFLSIFYPEHEWYVVLQKGIKTFVEKHLDGYILAYIIHFGKKRGEYIGLSCKVRVDKFGLFVKETDSFFKEFIHNYPGSNSLAGNTGGQESLFMDFSINSIYHSLHNFLPLLKGKINEDYAELWYKSSYFLMDVFNNEPFDKEDLFTAGLYLNLMLLLAFRESGDVYMNSHASFINDDLGENEYFQQFIESEPVLRDIKEDCLNIIGGNIKEELQPVAAWFKLFGNFLQPLNSRIEMQSALLEDIIINLRKQLCIASDGKCVIDFFIYKLLNPTPFNCLR